MGTTTPSLFTVQVAGNVGPNATDLYNLGASATEWNNIYGKFGNFTAGLQVGTNSLTVGSGTTPAASIAANTSFAGLVVDNKGSGDLFAASSSGLPRFVINSTGNVGIGNFDGQAGSGGHAGVTTPGATLHIARNISGLIGGENTWANYNLLLQNTGALNGEGTGLAFADTSNADNVGASIIFKRTGTNSKGELDFYTKNSTGQSISPNLAMVLSGGTQAIASISGSTPFAGLLVDNSGTGDLFTASSSGLNRFVITQAGNVGYRDNVPRKRHC